MATISSITEVSQPTIGQALKPRELGQDDFLKLLVTQLKNQDPLKPIDNSEFVAQLAQFSQLEQSAKQVKLLEQNIDAQTAALQFSMLSLVGRDVRVNGALMQYAGEPTAAHFTLDRDAASVGLTVLNRANQVVRTVQLGPLASGAQSGVWDGRDHNGDLVTPGTYRFAISALDSNGERVGVTTTSRLRVTGLRIDDGRPMLLVGEQMLDPGSIIELY